MKLWTIGVLIFIIKLGDVFCGLLEHIKCKYDETPKTECICEKSDNSSKSELSPPMDLEDAIKPFHGTNVLDLGSYGPKTRYPSPYQAGNKQFGQPPPGGNPYYPPGQSTGKIPGSGGCQPSTQPTSSCAQVYKGTPGVHTVELAGYGSFEVYCVPDRLKSQRAWTVVLWRDMGQEKFDRVFVDYERGFGNANQDHFVGLKKLHSWTSSQRHELWIQVSNDRKVMNSVFDRFAIGNSREGYIIHTLGQQLEGVGFDNFRTHMGNRFSTKDRDCSTEKCAKKYRAGWWFYENSWYEEHDCMDTYLTSKYNDCELPEYTFHHFDINGSRVKRAFMAIRPYEE